MNKLDSLSTSVTLSTSSTPVLETASWLIVIIPSIEADLTVAIQRVWELANTGNRRVRFIGLYENVAQELTLRRQLAGISAMRNKKAGLSPPSILSSCRAAAQTRAATLRRSLTGW